MKRFIIYVMALMLGLALHGCRRGTAAPDENNKPTVVCTVFPAYDWTREILGVQTDAVNLLLLQNGGVDLHSYQPTVDDFIKINLCDLFIYVGGESDEWVDDALEDGENPGRIVVNLLDVLGDAAKLEEIKAGMEDEEEESEGGEDEDEYDEHVWLSLTNAEIFCAAIADALSRLDAGNAGTYAANLSSYATALKALDAEYRAAVDTAACDTLLFADRFPFRYLVDDYGLDYHAAFPGCSAETEASFKTIIYLAEMTDELNLNTILVTESADKSIANTVISNTKEKNQRILTLDAMQSVTAADVGNGTTYLSIMRNNLKVLKEALG